MTHKASILPLFENDFWIGGRGGGREVIWTKSKRTAAFFSGCRPYDLWNNIGRKKREWKTPSGWSFWIIPIIFCKGISSSRWLTFTLHVWKQLNMLVYLHLGAFFHTCLDFNTYVREKAHMCEKSHTIIYLQMLGIFHTCVGKATDMLISPWAIGGKLFLWK